MDYKKGASHTYDCSFSNYFGSKHYDICQIVGNHMSRLTCSSIFHKCTCGSTYPNIIMDYKKGASHPQLLVFLIILEATIMISVLYVFL